MIKVTVPIKTVSEANSHTHWRERQKRAKFQRNMIYMVLVSHLRTELFSSVVVTLTRLSPSNGLDDDNLAGSQKHVRDGIADALGIDDRDPRVTWVYKQERAKTYGVKVEISKREDAPQTSITP